MRRLRQRSVAAMLAVLLLLLLGASPGFARGGKKKEKQGKGFEEVVKGFEAREGLFTIHTDGEKRYLEIRPEQYERDYLLAVSRVGGIGQHFPLLGDQQMWSAPVYFRKIGKRIQMLYRNHLFRAGRGPLGRAVERSFSDSLFASGEAASEPHPKRGSDLIDLSTLFIQDVDGLAAWSQQALQASYKADRDNSRVDWVAVFPGNVEIRTVMHFFNPAPRLSLETLVDERSMFIRYNFSICEIPRDDEYVPRLADDRVGHIVAPFADYSDQAAHTPYGRYVRRWKLEKADPLLEVSTVNEPITYWLDRTVPEEYRAAVRDGLLLWNDAFEGIGLKDAIVVKEAPDDPGWDSSDIRHSTVRWFIGVDSAFAIGPSFTDPSTGRIFAADIGFSEGVVRWTRREFREEVHPISRFAEAAQQVRLSARSESALPAALAGGSLPRAFASGMCTIGQELSRQAGFGHSLLAARGVRPGSREENAYIRDFLVHVAAHEMGHTLGLRHNFRASGLHGVEAVHDRPRTESEGLTGSVMDYIAVNLAAPGQAQGQYWQTTLGPYDHWAIEYAYTVTGAERPEDEREALARIASRAPEPALAYGTDEDAMHFVPEPLGMDPRVHVWDLGDDPIEYFHGRMTVVREVLETLPGSVLEEGQGFQVVRRAFNRAIGEYFPAVISITKFVGGVRHNRHHVGDPGGAPPYEPVPAAAQARALGWLATHLFGEESFRFDPELVRTLAAERFGRLSGLILLPRLDYPVHDLVLAIQDLALARLYHPALLARVVDMRTKVPAGEPSVGAAEVFGTLRDGIWSELAPAAGSVEIGSIRRALQRRHLEHLIDIATGGIPAAPPEAVAQARYDLQILGERIDALEESRVTDEAGRAHLAESREAIRQALAAIYVREA